MQHQNLWAPWRISYLQGLGENKSAAGPTDDPGGCFLCGAAKSDLSDEEFANRLLLIADNRGLLMMNRYPYANGHLLVAPHQHVADISDLSSEQRGGLMELADVGNRLLRKAMYCQGVNMGMNLGRCAGAGVPGHCHMHLVPRWNGDVNFMQVVAGARVIPQALEESYAALLKASQEIPE